MRIGGELLIGMKFLSGVMKMWNYMSVMVVQLCEYPKNL